MKIENLQKRKDENKVLVINHNGVQIPQHILDVEIILNDERKPLKEVFKLLECENEILSNQVEQLENELQVLKTKLAQAIDLIQKEINKKGAI